MYLIIQLSSIKTLDFFICSIIAKFFFMAFFEKIKKLKKIEKEEKFISFFTSFVDENIDEIEKLTGIRYDEDKFYFFKQAIDLINSYFDLQNVKSYFKEKLYIDNNIGGKIVGSISILGSASLIAFLTFFTGVNSSLLLIGGGIGVLISISLTAYFCYKIYKINKSLSNIEQLRKNMEFIEKFFDRMKSETEKDYNKSNVFIMAIDKIADNYGDFIFQPYYIKGINSIDNPKLDYFTDNNNIYKYYLKGFNYFKKKYEEKVKHSNISELTQEILKDFEILSTKKTVKEIEILLKESDNTVTESTLENETKEKDSTIKSYVNTGTELNSTVEFPNANNEVLDVEENKKPMEKNKEMGMVSI